MAFEAYRDLIRMKSLKLCEEEVLLLVENESVELRAAAKAAASHGSHHHPHHHFEPPSHAHTSTSVPPSVMTGVMEGDEV